MSGFAFPTLSKMQGSFDLLGGNFVVDSVADKYEKVLWENRILKGELIRCNYPSCKKHFDPNKMDDY